MDRGAETGMALLPLALSGTDGGSASPVASICMVAIGGLSWVALAVGIFGLEGGIPRFSSS